MTMLLATFLFTAILILSMMSPTTFKCCACGTLISNKSASKARRAWPLPCPLCGVEQHVSCPYNADVILCIPFILFWTGSFFSPWAQYPTTSVFSPRGDIAPIAMHLMVLTGFLYIVGRLVFSRAGGLVKTDSKLKRIARLGWIVLILWIVSWATL